MKWGSYQSFRWIQHTWEQGTITLGKLTNGRCQQTSMSITIQRKMRIIPFLNSFSPVLFSLVKQSNRLSSQHQNLRYFYYVLMDLEKRKIYLRRCKYCERKPRILKPELTENVSRYASLHYLSKPPKDEKNKVPKITMGKILF